MINEMHESFTRYKEFLDLGMTSRSPTGSKAVVHNIIHEATPEQLGLMLEVLNTGKTGQARGSLLQMMQKN